MSWVWYVVIGVSVLALVYLVLVARATAARVPPLRRAQIRLQQRLMAGQTTLQPGLDELQGRLADLQVRAEAVQVGLDELKRS